MRFGKWLDVNKLVYSMNTDFMWVNIETGKAATTESLYNDYIAYCQRSESQKDEWHT